MSIRREIALTPADGEYIFSLGILPDTPGFIADVVATDANGNEVFLNPGVVRFFSSPVSFGNVWRVIDSGSIQQQAARIRIVKSGVPAGVVMITAVITRSSFYPSNIPDGAFTGGRFIGIQDIKTTAIKNGNLFTASRLIASIPANSFVDSVIITGSKPLTLLARNIGYSGIGVAASIYRDATYTGTPVLADVQNPNDINPTSREFTLASGITFASGTLTVAVSYSRGNSSNQGQGNAQAVLGEMVIMKPNTAYVLRIQSLETVSAQDANSYITMIEGWPEIPI